MWVVKHWNKLTPCLLPTIPANIQGQIGLGSHQPDLVEDIPAHCKGFRLDDLSKSL